ncbi:hypothetical protein D7Y13_32435 [Corallococcus praedator]|uniref:Uncharacterized protein n=1 Tax=Corallococcus praedator TaxID=2316724 RepID=A0ABX9Q9G4_9BACT|nr:MULTISPECIES: hypothetical protein [Corallococcus]RKH19836.1 hypothetical protein D7X74_05790 [Corallococcus sp. CA047B]RKH33263.1 hypothetical protein D7X75_12845 [Corallococcus sp. CA031C]RKH95123.1 hypothetical protein D7Y13_32435 [Corallococcus praedator]
MSADAGIPQGAPAHRGGGHAEASYTDTGHSNDVWGFPQLPGNTRIVQTLTCVGDTSGNEAGTRTGCEAVLHDLTLTF